MCLVKYLAMLRSGEAQLGCSSLRWGMPKHKGYSPSLLYSQSLQSVQWSRYSTQLQNGSCGVCVCVCVCDVCFAESNGLDLRLHITLNDNDDDGDDYTVSRLLRV